MSELCTAAKLLIQNVIFACPVRYWLICCHHYVSWISLYVMDIGIYLECHYIYRGHRYLSYHYIPWTPLSIVNIIVYHGHLYPWWICLHIMNIIIYHVHHYMSQASLYITGIINITNTIILSLTNTQETPQASINAGGFSLQPLRN